MFGKKERIKENPCFLCFRLDRLRKYHIIPWNFFEWLVIIFSMGTYFIRQRLIGVYPPRPDGGGVQLHLLTSGNRSNNWGSWDGVRALNITIVKVRCCSFHISLPIARPPPLTFQSFLLFFCAPHKKLLDTDWVMKKTFIPITLKNAESVFFLS